MKLDDTKNSNTSSSNGEVEVSAADSKIKAFLIPTNEELVFVEDVVGIINETYSDHMNIPYSFLR